MAVRSIYLPDPQIQNNRIRIEGEEHRHLSVARIEADEAVEIFNGQGDVWMAVIESVDKRSTLARVSEARKVERDALQLTVGLALIRIPAFELALEKLVEVGVARIVPFVAARSNVAAGNRHERWSRILIEAAKQSKQYFIPVL